MFVLVPGARSTFRSAETVVVAPGASGTGSGTSVLVLPMVNRTVVGLSSGAAPVLLMSAVKVLMPGGRPASAEGAPRLCGAAAGKLVVTFTTCRLGEGSSDTAGPGGAPCTWPL